MKKIVLILMILMINIFNMFPQGVVISENKDDTPDASAILDVKSTSKGVLLPRMNYITMTNISNKEKGLMVFFTDTDKMGLWFWDGSQWHNLFQVAPEETDPEFEKSEANKITHSGSGKVVTNTERTNWNEAHNWGNHANENYLKSYTETDPKYTGSEAEKITDAGSGKVIMNSERNNWNTAYGWGDHSNEGYLKSYNETDPQVGNISNNSIPKWNGSSLVSGAITDNGNVGIGTTNPSEKLEVNGNIRADEVVTNAGFFQRREGSAIYDFDLRDYEANTWHTLSISSIVPSDAKAILIYVSLEANSAGRNAHFDLDLNSICCVTRSIVNTIGDGVHTHQDIIIPYDSNLGTISFTLSGSNSNWNYATITIKGWWK